MNQTKTEKYFNPKEFPLYKMRASLIRAVSVIQGTEMTHNYRSPLPRTNLSYAAEQVRAT